MENILPSEIKINILSRLPAESIYECKQVCKNWRNLIKYDRSFTRMHQSRVYENEQNNSGDAASSGKTTLLFAIANMINCRKQFYYANCSPSEDLMEYTRINLIPVDDSKIYRILGSCNGLVCVSKDPDSRMDKPIYICNPITKEYLLLPSLSDTNFGSFNFIECGFGYVPSTNEYKVVKIHQCHGKVGKWVYVYTLGSGKGWRYISEITYKLNPNYRSVFVNGALHWVDTTQGNIVAFDLTEEKFSMISLTPTCFVNNWPLDDKHSSYKLQVLGGSLCIVHQYNYTWYDIWSLKKGNNGIEYSHWSKDFDTFKFGCDFGYTPWAKIFDVTEDEVLFCNEYTFYSYNFKQTRDNKFEWILDSIRNTGMHVREAFLHVNSFVSLKALGEEDTKIFESTEVDNFDDGTCAEDGDLSICKKNPAQSRKGFESWVESELKAKDPLEEDEPEVSPLADIVTEPATVGRTVTNRDLKHGIKKEGT